VAYCDTDVKIHSFWCWITMWCLRLYHPIKIAHFFLLNKTNRCIEFQFYWYYDSTYFGQPFCPSSGVLSLTSQMHKMYQSRCKAKNSWWWTEWLPETCRIVIPIKLEFSASVGFIHKESVTMHGHTIVKKHISYHQVVFIYFTLLLHYFIPMDSFRYCCNFTS